MTIYQDAAVQAFECAPRVSIDLISRTIGEYDPLTGTQSTVENSATIEAVRASIDASEVDESIKNTDIKFFVLQSSLNAEPTTHDSVMYKGCEFEILRVKPDSADASWWLVCRAI